MARNMKCSETGKDVHFTERSAEKAIATYSRKTGISLYKYRCRLCKHWHLTHQRRQAVILEGFSA